MPLSQNSMRVATMSLVLALLACDADDATAPGVELAVTGVFQDGNATCDFGYQCTMTVRYVTTNLVTGQNTGGEVAISGNGTFPATSTSGLLGVGDFTWSFPAEPGTHTIRVCPNVSTPIESRCRSMEVALGG